MRRRKLAPIHYGAVSNWKNGHWSNGQPPPPLASRQGVDSGTDDPTDDCDGTAVNRTQKRCTAVLAWVDLAHLDLDASAQTEAWLSHGASVLSRFEMTPNFGRCAARAQRREIRVVLCEPDLADVVTIIDVAFYGPNASLLGKFSEQGGSKPQNLKDLTPSVSKQQQQQPASSTLAEWTTLADERCLHSRQIAQKIFDANGAPGFGVGTRLCSMSALTSASRAGIPAPGGNAGRAKKGIARNERMQVLCTCSSCRREAAFI
ncbi:hypothetical protein CPLU01_02719 [Colletotrichum plurivorum]|uniref:Uncharacterized protein n=1 Tax=Colletotrichum plurivorum TaxID=2175906 RepID=A0A8H6NMQ4_9PEZI|nr:hypothetical protein CPLU01_02719 [Colletotrichum plurivorum]